MGSTFWGYAFSVGAAISWAVATILIRKGITDLASPLIGATISLFFGTLFMAGLSLRSPALPIPHRREAVLLFLVSGLLSGSGVAANYYALQVAPVVLVAPVTSIFPLVTLICAQLFLQRWETVSLRVWLGTILVVGGVVLVALGRA